jgi:iron complex outermembrane receptor protein
MIRNKRCIAWLASAAMISLSAAGAGFPGSPATSGGITATSQPADEGRVGLDEIVVTAQKRAQNIQDVPITVSAFSGAELQERGVTQVSQLANYTPNVQLTSTSQFLSSPAMLSAFIRGIGQDDFSVNFEPGVGTYVDGVYLARTIGANANLLDVERVEILKGPQGTLFGRNTIGGAISVVTRDPADTSGAHVEVTGGRFDRFGVGVVVDMPIIDNTLLSSVAFSSEKRQGYQRRITFPGSGGFVTDDPRVFRQNEFDFRGNAGGIDSQSIRAKLLWMPRSGVRVTLIGDYTREDQGASPSTLLKTAQNSPGGPAGFTLVGLYNHCINTPAATLAAQGPFGAVCGLRANAGTSMAGVNVDGDPNNNRLTVDDRFVTGNIDTTYNTGVNFSSLNSHGVTGIVDVDLADHLTLKSITAYRDLNSGIGIDLDGTPVAIFETTDEIKQDQFSQELQLVGKAFDNRLNWLAGAYYFHEHALESNPVVFSAGLQQIVAPNSFQTYSAALFTHLNYAFTDKLSMTLGGRYTDEHKEFIGGQSDLNELLIKFGVPPVVFPVPSNPTILYPPGLNKLKANNFSPRAGLEFHPVNDVMIYASYSKGFKSGGWTSRLTFPESVAPTFDEETATSYEVGLKSEFLERRLQVNFAGFLTNYDGIQLSIQRGVSPTFENAGRARIKGLELETQAVVTDALRVFASAGVIDAYYLSVNDPTGVINIQSDLPKTPKTTAHIGPEYEIHLPSAAAITVRGDYSYRSRAANDAENSPDVYARAVSLVDLSATYAPAGKKWSLTVGGTNVFDRRYIVNGVDQLGGVGVELATYNRPAEWYASFRFKL